MNNKVNSNFLLGVVVQNNDPEHKGRVKIYIPHIYPIDNDKLKPTIQDNFFTFPMESNTEQETPLNSDIMDYLKNILPWAEPALPLFGGNATGRYNAFTKKATTSDSNKWDNNESNNPSVTYGPRGAQQFTRNNKLNKDEFSIQQGLVPPNPYSFDYNPPDYSNTARGLFTIPNVGSHLWVFFKEGNHMCPVYFAACHGGNDFNGIYDYNSDGILCSVDYPNNYENQSKPNQIDKADALTFRNKTVLNSNKNTIELIDTDLREILRLTHYSGSFKEFNNLSNIELATKNDQKLVHGDQYVTVKGHQATSIGLNHDLIIGGDFSLQIGKPITTLLNDINVLYSLNSQIANINRLFDIQRCNFKENSNYSEMSSLQKQVANSQSLGDLYPPGFSKCPVCKGEQFDDANQIIENWAFYTWIPEKYRGMMFFEWTWAFLALAEYKIALAESLSALLGIPGIKNGYFCSTCGPDGNPTGFSPSTESGNWLPEPLKQVDTYSKAIADVQSKLLSVNASISDGDQVLSTNKDKFETIGLKMNDFKPYRIDPSGKLRIEGITVAPGGVYETFIPSPLVEPVDVPDMPGDYNLTCNNKYKLLVGAKGIDIKSFGPLNLIGAIINFSGDQINITSAQEVNFDGGKRLTIRAKNISFHPYEHDPIVMDSPLNITRNLTVMGGTYFDGEVGLQHITCPAEMQESLWMGGPGSTGFTASTSIEVENPEGFVSNGNEKTLFKTDADCWQDVYLIDGVIVPNGVPAEVPPHVHRIPPHTHVFFNVPAKYCFSREQVRALMMENGINSQNIVVAALPNSQAIVMNSEIDDETYSILQVFHNKCSEVLNDKFKGYKAEDNSFNYQWDDVATMEHVPTKSKTDGYTKLTGCFYQYDYILGSEITYDTTGAIKFTKKFTITGTITKYDEDGRITIEGVNCSDSAGSGGDSVHGKWPSAFDDIKKAIMDG